MCVYVPEFNNRTQYLPFWCPLRAITFISGLPKVVPDGMLSSNALQAEEVRVCFHRRDDAYLDI